MTTPKYPEIMKIVKSVVDRHYLLVKIDRNIPASGIFMGTRTTSLTTSLDAGIYKTNNFLFILCFSNIISLSTAQHAINIFNVA
jgi:hypothetical protein